MCMLPTVRVALTIGRWKWFLRLHSCSASRSKASRRAVDMGEKRESDDESGNAYYVQLRARDKRVAHVLKLSSKQIFHCTASILN